MGELRRPRNDNRGVLSIIDGMIFGMIVIIATLFIFQVFGGALTGERDLRSAELRKEAAQDIQNAALASSIEETALTNESWKRNVTIEYDNLTVERAVKEYLYFDHKNETDENLSYDLSGLETDIEELYKVCAWEVSHYHFAVGASYGQSELFLSDLSGIDSINDLPSDRGAATSTLTLNGQQVDITLYIWR